MATTELTANASAFVAANKRSPVIEGSVVSHTEGGGHYRLKNGKLFTLSAEECRMVKSRWDI